MLSVRQVRAAIFNRLTTTRAVSDLVGSRVYHARAPAGATYPFVVINKQSGTPTYTFGDRAWDDQTWLAKCVDRSTSSNTAEDAQAAIDGALTDAPLSIDGGALLYLRRMSDIEYVETIDGVDYRHHGGLYRAVVR